MYTFSTVNENLGVSSLYHAFNDSALCVVIENSDWHLSQAEDTSGFDSLLLEGLHSLKSETRICDMPLEFAHKLDSLLKEKNINAGRDSNLVGFVAVALRKENVFVCTAGISRVHLIRADHPIQVTRDHNLVDDFLNNSDEVVDVTYERHSAVFHSKTRMLGSTNPDNKPPETLRWDVEGDYKILICSSVYHEFGDPDEYTKSLLGSDLVNLSEHEKKIGGFLAIIKRANEGILTL